MQSTAGLTQSLHPILPSPQAKFNCEQKTYMHVPTPGEDSLQNPYEQGKGAQSGATSAFGFGTQVL